MIDQLFTNFSSPLFMTNLGGALGGAFGTLLGSQVLAPTNQDGALGSQIGSTLGGDIGGILGQGLIPIPSLGMIIGDFIGSFAFLPEDSYPSYRRFAAAVNPFGLLLLTLLARLRGVYMFSVPLVFTGGAHTDDDLDELFAVVTDAALELQRHDFPFFLEGPPA